MTKTTNYQLPQWEAHDPIRRGDFNAAFASLDAGLAGVRSEALGAAAAAQETADGAYSAERPPCLCGSKAVANGTAIGTKVLSFSWPIKGIIANTGNGELILLAQGITSGYLPCVSPGSEEQRSMKLQISGTTVTLQGWGESMTSSSFTFYYLVFF